MPLFRDAVLPSWVTALIGSGLFILGFFLSKSRVMAGLRQWFTSVPSAKVKEAIQNEGGEARLSSCLVTAVRDPCFSAEAASENPFHLLQPAPLNSLRSGVDMMCLLLHHTAVGQPFSSESSYSLPPFKTLHRFQLPLKKHAS